MLVNQITHAVVAVSVVAGATVSLCLGQMDVAAVIPIYLAALGVETAATIQQTSKSSR